MNLSLIKNLKISNRLIGILRPIKNFKMSSNDYKNVLQYWFGKDLTVLNTKEYQGNYHVI